MESIKTKVRLYYKGEDIRRVITYNSPLTEDETHRKFIGKTETFDGVRMKCWKVETIDIKKW